ncbi:MAG: hypothetical protein ACXWNZ_10590 [Vulcanimicrobiaceae bacterium]
MPPPGTPNSIPAVGGYSGSFTLAANDAPAGTNVMLTSCTVTPGGAPAAQSLVSPTVLFWVSHVYSQTATFDAFPITSWQLAATPGTGANIFLETFDGSTLLATEQATSVNGPSVNFPGVQKTFQAAASHTYWWELISASGFTPVTPPPSTPAPSPA